MEVTNTMGAGELLRKYLTESDPDLVRSMVQAFAETLMSAEASGLCNAEYGEVSPGPGEPEKRISDQALGHESGINRPRHPEAQVRQLLPGLAYRASPAC